MSLSFKHVQIPLDEEKAKQLLKRAKTSSYRVALLKAVVHYLLCDRTGDETLQSKQKYAQTVLYEDVLQRLLEKTGVCSVYEALAIAVYHYISCPEVCKDESSSIHKSKH